MKSKYVHWFLAGALTSAFGSVYAKNADKCVEHVSEDHIQTDAGIMDFRVFHVAKFPAVFHKISRFFIKENAFELPDGSKWSTSKIDLVKGWEGNSLVIVPNHATFSTHRFALVNKDLKLAVPISLELEPIPQKEGVYFIRNIDQANDLMTLSDGRRWIVNSSDISNLSKMKEHDRVIIGANIKEGWDKSPYVLIDTAHNIYVRANLID